jgi:putative membrane protein
MERPSQGTPPDSPADASRRTRLASERTELAWWRTGLASLAVAIGVSRVVPDLTKTSHHWAYVAAGVCFAVYGVAVVVYGSARAAAVERALAHGRFPETPRIAHGVLVAGLVALGLITLVLVLLG